MTRLRFLSLLFVVLAASPLSATGGDQAPDHKGADFFLAFPQNGTIARVAIKSAANSGAGLVRITTVSAHGIPNGQYAVIEGVAGTTEANGTWQIANATLTTFDLVGSAFVNPYVSGGFTDRAPTITLFLSNDAASPVRVELSSPSFLTTHVDVPASTVLPVSIVPTVQITTVNAVSNQGVRVRTVAPEGATIAAYVLSRRPFPGPAVSTGDGAYVALPLDALGSEYRVASRPGNSQATVVATEPDTIVTITRFSTTSGGTTVSAPFQVSLDQLQTYLLQQTDDLTGTLVAADKPIAVFGGNQSGTVAGASPDHMIEQMVPTSAWGDSFVIAPVGPSSIGNSLVRVLAHESDTTVEVNGTPVETLAAGEFHDFTLTSSSGASVRTYRQIGTAEEVKPALVVQYKNGDAPATDPFLMLIPPVNQFSRHYLFRTPSGISNQQLNIMARDGDEVGILLNGASITGWAPIAGPLGAPYKYARVSLPANAQRLLEHTEPTVRFGAWVYGHALAEGFGFAAGQLVTDDTPPIISADSVPASFALEATGPGGATAAWETPTATDFGRGQLPVTCNPASGSEISLGSQLVHCSATDPAGNTAAAGFTVTVVDTTPPVLHLPADITVHATSGDGARVSYTASATDIVDPDVTVTCAPASDTVFPLGPDRLTKQTLVSCAASDDSPDSPDALGQFTVTVTNSAPACTMAVPSVPVIWPPLRTMVPISINGVVDPDGDSVSIIISRIFQDEPVYTGRESRRWQLPDGAGVGTSLAQVRAERSGRGDGRVYHIGFTATDSLGASCMGEVTVAVPHDRRRTAVDGGPLHDSTVVPVIVRPPHDEADDDDQDEDEDDD